MGRKLFRFIMSPIVGYCFGRAIFEFTKNSQWGLLFLTVMIFVLGASILVCVWDLINYRTAKPSVASSKEETDK